MDNLPEMINKVSIILNLHPGKLAKEAYFYALEAAYLESYPEQMTQFDGKDGYLILLVQNGSGRLTYKNAEYTLAPGNLIYINCKNKHKLCTADGWDVIYLYFNGRQAHGNFKIISQKQISPVYYIENTYMVHSVMWQIISAHKGEKHNAEALTSLNINKLLTEIYSMSNCGNGTIAGFPQCVHYVFHYVAHNYRKKITLDMIANKYSVSKFHMSREFKRYSGMTVNEYIIDTRINHAKVLLRLSEKSVKQIALEAGFLNSSHFVETFRKREGMTPGIYRKQWV